MSKSSKRVPVLIDRELYDHFKFYAAQTGVTATNAIREALQDWYDTVGEARIEAITVASFTNLVNVEKLQANIAKVIPFPTKFQIN